MKNLFKLGEISGVFVDAYLADDSGNLLHVSVWGRDTALQELLARMQLPRSDNGIRELHIQGDNLNKLIRMPNVDDLDKTTFKVPVTTIYGELTQMWIYDKLAIRPDLTNHRALMLYPIEDQQPDLWPLVKSVCHLPLLDEWKDVFLSRCTEKQWIHVLENSYGISGIYIELDKEEVGMLMTDMIQRFELTLPAEYGQLSEKTSKEQGSIFDGADIIYTYTRQQAIEDGVLVDVSEIGKEAGFKTPVALTRTVWEDCVEWNDEDSKRQKIHQDQEGRLWDVVYMASMAARKSKTSSEVIYQIYRVPRGGRAQKAKLVHLKSHIGPGDRGEPVITIMQPNED